MLDLDECEIDELLDHLIPGTNDKVQFPWKEKELQLISRVENNLITSYSVGNYGNCNYCNNYFICRPALKTNKHWRNFMPVYEDPSRIPDDISRYYPKMQRH